MLQFIDLIFEFDEDKRKCFPFEQITTTLYRSIYSNSLFKAPFQAVSKQFEFKAQFPQKISIGSAIEFSLPQLSSFQLLGTIQVDANQNLSQLPNFYSRFEQTDSIDCPIGAKQRKKRNFVLFMMCIHQLIPKNWHKNKDCKKRTYKFKVYFRQLIKMKSFSFYPR